MLGAADVAEEPSSCGMPVSLQVQRLRLDLARRVGDAVSVLEVDLYALTGADRDAALDALVAGAPSPYVLIGGRLVCTGAIDLEAIRAVLA